MRVWLLDESTLAKDKLTRTILTQIANACTVQATEHFGAMWESFGAQVFVAGAATDVPADDAAIVIYDNADSPGALGDHETNWAGRPSGRIFLGPILANGGDIVSGPFALSAVISHEVLELVGDPYVNSWADGANGKQYAAEVCDPVESDSYPIDGVLVSNFVGPRWFSAGPGPYDWLRTLTQPFTMAAGGYMIVRDPGGDARQVFGADFPAWKKPLKYFGRAARR